MEDEKIRLETLNVASWERELNFDQGGIFKLSHNLKFVGYLKDESFRVVSLNNSARSSQVFPKISDFIFGESFNQESKLAVLSKNGGVDVFEIDFNADDFLTRLRGLFSLSENSKPQRGRFLNFTDNFLTMLDDFSVIQFNFEENNLTNFIDFSKCTWWNSTSDIVDVKLRAKHLFVLTPREIYQIEKQSKDVLAQIDLNTSLNREIPILPQSISIHEEENCVLVTCTQGQCLLARLNQIRTTNSSYLQASKCRSYWDCIVEDDKPQKTTTKSSRWSLTNFQVEGIFNADLIGSYIYLWTYIESRYKFTVMDQNGRTLASLNLPSQVFSVKSGFPNIALTDKFLIAIVHLPQQEMLVNKVIVYGGSMLTDKMFTLNNWYHVKMPISILEWGLRNHQLDMISLILRSQNLEDCPESDFIAIMDLICNVIKPNVRGNSSCTFAEQLLKLTLQYLVGYLDRCSQSEIASQNKLEDLVIKYILIFRKCLTFSSPESTSKVVSIVEEIPLISPQDAIINRHIPILQANLLQSESIETSSFDYVKKLAVNLADEFIHNRNVDGARQVLVNSGIDWRIHFESVREILLDRNLRDFLLNIDDLPEDSDLIERIHQIESYYPSESFNSSCDFISSQINFDNRQLINFGIPLVPEACLICSSEYSPSQIEETNVSYSNLRLDWVKKMENDGISLILCEGIHRSRSNDFSDIDDFSVLKYILSHDEVDFLPLLFKNSRDLNFDCVDCPELITNLAKIAYFKNNSTDKLSNNWQTSLKYRAMSMDISPDEILSCDSFYSACSEFNLVNILLERDSLLKNRDETSMNILESVVNNFLRWQFDESAENILKASTEVTKYLGDVSLDNSISSWFFVNNQNNDVIDNTTNGYLTDFPLYDMLRDSVPFYVGQILNWQNFSREYFKDSPSSFDIVSPFTLKYFCRHQVGLDFIHYLKQSRPCYAFVHFVLQEVAQFKTCDKQRIKRASSLALNLALSNLTCDSIVSSCIVFIELINSNSNRLRATSNLANMINWKNYASNGGNLSNLVDSVAKLSVKDYDGSKTGILNCRDFVVKLYNWKTLLEFSELCSLDLSLDFPLSCAINNNWLETVLICQRCFYSPSTLRDLCCHLNVSDHLKNSLIQLHFEKKSKSSLLFKRDTRSTLYEKIGLVEHVELKIPESSSETTSVDEIEVFSEDPTPFKNDLFFNLLYYEHNMTELIRSVSPSNPILILFASCIENDGNLFQTWLHNVANSTRDSISLVKESNLEPIFQNCWWFLIFSFGLSLFEADSFLSCLLESMKVLIDNCDNNKFSDKMIEFTESQTECSNLTSDFICKFSLYGCSLFKLYQFFKCLHRVDFTELIKCPDGLNFGLVSNVQSSLFDSLIRVPFAKWWNVEEKLPEKFRNFVDFLLQRNLQRESLAVQKILNVPSDCITIHELRQLLVELSRGEKWMNDSSSRNIFWQFCVEKCCKRKIDFNISEKLFEKCIELARCNIEKYYLIKLILRNWGNEMSEKQITKFGKEMWMRRVNAQIQFEFVNTDCQVYFSICDSISSGFFHTRKNLTNAIGFVPKCESEKIDPTTLDGIVAYELDHDNIADAFRLAKYFNHDCHHLNLIMNLMDLAEGRIQVNEIDFHSLREKSQKFSHRRIRTSSNLGVFDDETGVINGLEKLRELCSNGVVFCGRIVTFYKVALLLGMTYTNVINECDLFDLVRLLLKIKTSEAISLAKQLFIENCVCDKQVAQFVCDEIVSRLFAVIFDSKPENLESNIDSIPDFTSVFLEFQELMRLVRETSLVGNLLLTESDKVTTNVARVELYIWAHHCFSSACNTEGIAQVLAKCRQLTMSLGVCDYVLLVHLLLGIARYSEMVYVFDLLMDSRQFELLLKKKGTDKLNVLQIPLLDYLCRSHQSNMDLFIMTALHFCLYREIAEMLEAAVERQLEIFTSNELNSGSGELEKALRYLEEAAESYSKASCFSRANSCCRRAELISLQLFLAPAGKRVVGLTTEQLGKFIETNPDFNESYLVSVSYQENSFWISALYKNVIMDGNFEYLNQFHNCIGINETIAEDLCLRFAKDKSATEKMAINLRRILNLMPNVVVKFKLSSMYLPSNCVVRMESDTIYDFVSRGFVKEQKL